MSSVFDAATAVAVKPPPGPVQYRAVRAAITDAEHGRMQLAINLATAEPCILQVKPTVSVTGTPVDAVNTRNREVHALRAEGHALKLELIALAEERETRDITDGDADDKRIADRVDAIGKRADAIDALVKAQPKIGALVCAPVAKALMLMSAEDERAEDERAAAEQAAEQASA